MADDGSGGLTVPSNDNWSEWTFEQALKALTSEGVDLHAPAKATWFNFNSSPGGSDWFFYRAWGEYYFGVNRNDDAINAWATAVDTIDEMMPDVLRGKRGSMDLGTLAQLAVLINEFTIWSQTTSGGFNQWASRLKSDDSSFKGKAAFLIYWRLKMEGDGLNDTYEQLFSRHGRPTFVSVAEASQQLGIFNSSMSHAWQTALSYDLRYWISLQIADISDHINTYLQSMGLYKDSPNYILDAMVADHNLDYAKSYVREVVSGSSYGDLTKSDTWQSLSNRITQNTLNNLKGFLDGPAQIAIAALAPKYTMATSALMEITAPPPETPPKTDTNPPGGGGGNDSNLPPPPDGGGGGGGGGNLPPPPDGGGGGNDKLNLPPADGGGGGGNLPPPADGGGGSGGLDLGNGGGGPGGLDLANGGGGPGGLDLGNGGGGPGGLDLANGGGGPNELNPAGGGGPTGGGAGGFLPGLVPPGGGADGNGGINGKNGIGPGSDGAFNENGLGNNLLKPPPADGGGGSKLPLGSGQSKTLLPPGAKGGGPDGLVNLGKTPKGVAGAGGGLNTGPGGFGSDPGKGFGSGANLLGVNGGAGNPLGGPDGSTGPSSLLNGGTPGAPGAPGSSGGNGNGSGGVPFYPPTMGGGGGAPGDKPQERERQTWLTEDEDVWGTRVDVRSGAIGRLDEEEYEVEEFPLVGPARRQRRADTPRRPRPDEKPDAVREVPSSEEASGSA